MTLNAEAQSTQTSRLRPGAFTAEPFPSKARGYDNHAAKGGWRAISFEADIIVPAVPAVQAQELPTVCLA
jgi:hypothetical protein